MNSNSTEQRLEAIEERLAELEVGWALAQPHTKPSVAIEAKPSLRMRHDYLLKPMSGIWLGLVATVCFILAAAFIIKLSLASGWLTHEKQLVLVTLLGLSLLTAGIFISSTDMMYASFLPAAGSIILYLTCFAAYQYYMLTTFQTLIVFTSFISAISIGFYVQFKHDIYAIVAVLGSYSAVLIAPAESNALFSLYYLVLCSFTFATISILVQSRILTVISSYLAILCTAYLGLNLNRDGLIAIILALNFLIFSIGSYFHTHLTQRGLSLVEAWSLFPVLLIFYAMEFFFINRIEPNYAPWVSLGMIAFLIALYFSAKKRSLDNALNSNIVLLSFVTVVCYHSIYLVLLPEAFKPWLFVLIVLGYCFIRTKERLIKVNAAFIAPILALGSILGIEYLNMLSHLVMGYSLAWTLVSWAAFFSLWLAYFMHHKELNKKTEYGYFLLSTAHLLCIIALYQLTNQYGSLAVSSSWLLYALIVLSFSRAYNDVLTAKSMLIVLLCAAGKALLYDAASTPTIIRALSLILTGTVLYTSGLVIRKMSHEYKKVP